MIHHGDALDVMAGMEPESVDAVVTDPPYGLEFMGKEWDAPWRKGSGVGEHNAGFRPMDGPRDQRAGHEGGTWFASRDGDAPSYLGSTNPTCRSCGGTQNGNDRKSRRRCRCDAPSFPNTTLPRMLALQGWTQQWAEAAYRVAKPSAYLLAFGGTRTVHRLTVALEDAGWIIRDLLVWGYASGFPKSKASLKPAWEPIVLARKPGPLRDLAIDACRIGYASPEEVEVVKNRSGGKGGAFAGELYGDEAPGYRVNDERFANVNPSGRWPANIVLTDPIFDGGWEGVVGGGETGPAGVAVRRNGGGGDFFGGIAPKFKPDVPWDDMGYGDSGTYSRFFLVPKSSRADREPPGASGARVNTHPTCKPTALMAHLLRLVVPLGGIALDPFMGSGSTLVAAQREGIECIGIEREAEYVEIAEARLNGTQKGLGLDVPAPTPPGPTRKDGVIGGNKLGAHFGQFRAGTEDVA